MKKSSSSSRKCCLISAMIVSETRHPQPADNLNSHKFREFIVFKMLLEKKEKRVWRGVKKHGANMPFIAQPDTDIIFALGLFMGLVRNRKSFFPVFAFVCSLAICLWLWTLPLNCHPWNEAFFFAVAFVSYGFWVFYRMRCDAGIFAWEFNQKTLIGWGCCSEASWARLRAILWHKSFQIEQHHDDAFDLYFMLSSPSICVMQALIRSRSFFFC